MIEIISYKEFVGVWGIMSEAAARAQKRTKRQSSRARMGAVTVGVLQALRSRYDLQDDLRVIESLLTRFIFTGKLTLQEQFSQWVVSADNKPPSVTESIVRVAAKIPVSYLDTSFDYELFLNMLLDQEKNSKSDASSV